MVWDFASSDIETDGSLDPRKKPIGQWGFGYGPGQTYRERYNESHRGQYNKVLHSGKRVVWHNCMFDVPYINYYGYELDLEHCEDTMLGLHMLNPDMPLGLEMVNSLFVHAKPWWGGKNKDDNKWSSPNYHAMDLDVTFRGWQAIETELHREGKWHLYRTESMPVAYACMKLKEKGIHVDRERMIKMWGVWTKRIEQLDSALHKIKPIEWNSPAQVSKLFYKEWGFPVQYTSSTNARIQIAYSGQAGARGERPTVNAMALQNLLGLTNHPATKFLWYKRMLEKQRTMWLQYDLDDKDFYHFDISFVNATGRAKGDLLTIQHGPMRELFIPDEPEWEFADADWSAVELWIGAAASGDENYKKILGQDKSFHEYAGTEVLERPVTKKGTPDLYEQSKDISHGTAFGRSIEAIAKEYEIPKWRVEKYHRWLKTNFPTWWNWREGRLKEANETGQLTNPFGFTRYFWSGNIRGMVFANEPQSCVAHMVKRTMMRLQEQLPKPARVVFPWHDAIVITYPPELKEEALRCLKENMEVAWPELGGWRGKTEITTGKNLRQATRG